MRRLHFSGVSVGLAAGLLVSSFGTAYSTTDQPAAQADVVSVLDSVVVGGKVALNTRSGRGREVGALSTARSLVDAATGEVLGAGSLRMKVAAEGVTPGLRSCIKDGKNKKLEIFDHFDRYAATQRGSVHFQYHPYRLAEARRVGGRWTSQWEVCSIGGGEFDDHRLRRVGTGIALDDATNFRKIGQAWQTGSTPENYTLGLGFQVKKDPVAISASLTQHPADKLLGSHRGPWSTFMDSYDRNAVNAWWQDNCIGRWYRCWPKSGSHDYQGAIAHGLWEFPSGTEPVDVAFYFVLYAAV